MFSRGHFGGLFLFRGSYGFLGLDCFGRCRMAHFQRLIFVVLVMLAAWLPTSSYASFPPSSGSGYVADFNGTPGSGATALDACNAAGNARMAISAIQVPANAPWTWYGATSAANGSCAGSYSNKYSGVVSASLSYGPALVCPANSTLSSGSCSCNAPSFSQVGTGVGSTCVNQDAARCDATKGGSDLFTGYSSFPAFGSAYCPNSGNASGCGATISGGFATVKNGVKNWTYEVQYTGTPCTPPAVGDPAVGKETTCKGTEGVINGKTVCIPASKNDTNIIKSEKKGAAPDGSTTTEQSETTCNGSKCTTTTTTTTTPPGGGTPTTTTTTKEEPKDDFCTKNPRASACVTSSYSDGSCATPPACDGDAIQCAIAAQAKRTACALSPDPDGSDADYIAAKAKPLASVTGDLPGNSTVSIGPGSFDQSDALGGGSCIADRSVAVMGHALVIPLSRVCVHLALLGNALLLFSFLLAGRIVVRG